MLLAVAEIKHEHRCTWARHDGTVRSRCISRASTELPQSADATEVDAFDDEITESLQANLAVMRERSIGHVLFPPRASGMGHDIGDYRGQSVLD